MPTGPAQSHYFGGGTAETLLSPFVLVLLLIAIGLIMGVPRKYVIIPVMGIAFLVPEGQSVYAVGVHWLVLRIVVLVGLLRVAILKASWKGPIFAGGFNNIDRAFLVCAIAQAVGTSLQYMDSGALVNQFGVLIDFVGAYFLLRVLIQDEADTYRTLKCLAVLAVILGACMIREQISLQNIFGQIGLERTVPEIREGKVRSQGVFQHSLTAGTFGATLLPLFVLLWKNGKARVMGAFGVLGCTTMTICSNSSTPLLAYVGGVLGMALWPIRKKMKMVRWGIVATLLGLQLVMKAPFWFVIAHIDLTGGSSGYHRAELIDQFINHFRDWWLIGTKDAGTWAYDMWDQQNQYVGIGEAGGLVALVFFIAMICHAYAKVGTARRLVQGARKEWFLWLMGAAFFSNLVAFFGVNYFDQVKMVWFALLAMISATTAAIMKAEKVKISSADAEVAVVALPASGPLVEEEEPLLAATDTSRSSRSVSSGMIDG